MRVCYFGTYEEDYPRNELFIEGLRRAGISLFLCHESIWKGQRDKTGAYRGLMLLRMLVRIVLAYVRLAVRYLRMPPHDVIMVGYIGHLDMLLAWGLSRVRGVPLAFNVTLSLFDTFTGGRGLVATGSLTGRAFWLLDWLSCRAADVLFTDTQPYADYFVQTFGVSPARVCVVPLGADDRLFTRLSPPPQDSAVCQVVFVGKFIPLHGCETIVRAAALLRHEPVHFTMIGDGQQYPLVQALIQQYRLTNITLMGWIERHELGAHYTKADICLGSFGPSGRAGRAISNKVYESMAMQRAVLTSDTPAVRAELRSGEEVWVCRPADEVDMARQLKRLVHDPALRERLAQQGHIAFQQRYHLQAIGTRIRRCLSRVVHSAEGGNV